MERQRINIMDEEQQPVAEVSPKEESEQVAYASVTERFVALLIDYAIIFFPGQLIIRLILKVFEEDLELWHVYGLFGAMVGIFILYQAIFSCGDRVTLGKSLVGIAVVKKDLSGPISFFRSLARAIGYVFSAVIFFFGFLFSFFDDKHRALHDFLGDSVVVQIRKKATWEKLSIRAVGGILLCTLSWTVYNQYFGGGNLVQAYYVRHAKDFLKKVALLEDVHYDYYGYYTNDLLRLALLSGDPVQFQRDIKKSLATKGFKIGVNEKQYKISAVAKDNKNTRVFYSSDN